MLGVNNGKFVTKKEWVLESLEFFKDWVVLFLKKKIGLCG